MLKRVCYKKFSRKLLVLMASSSLLACSSLSLPSFISHQVAMEDLPSKNYSQRIKFLVMHYTAGNYQHAIGALVNGEHVSSHYLVPESNDKSYLEDELKVIRLVDESKRSWHAGGSYWQEREDINDQSIGIEIVNVPFCKEQPIHRCFFPDYDPKQIELLIKLSRDILKRNPDISPTKVVGHADIAPLRKKDPGPRFPWYQLYQSGIGAWYEEDAVQKYVELFDARSPDLGVIQQAFNQYGYGLLATGELNAKTLAVIHAFQTHFLPWHITDKADAETVATLFALLEKYFPTQNEKILARYQQEGHLEPITDWQVNNGQIDQIFPEIDRSTRELVNDRALFKSYKGRGELIIDNNDVVTADIYVNGEKLNLDQPFQAHQRYQYSLKKRTKTGDNTLRIENIQPENATFNITIPYPMLMPLKKDSHRKFTKVDALINGEIEQGFPGAVLLVMKDGKVLKNTAYGFARKFADGGELLDAPVKMSKETLFDIASNTKMFATNFALMKLITENKLDVSLPIQHYLPQYKGAGRELRLVKDILTHTAGYAPQVRFFTHENALGENFFSQNTERTKQLILTKVPFAVGRNTQHIYSDTDYMLLGMLVEKISGLTLDQYVEYEIYHPLGLKHILYNPLKKGFNKNQFAATEIAGNTRGGRVSFEHVRDYVLQGEVHDEKAFHSFGGVAGHAGLFSTTEDLAVLAQTLLNRGGYGNKQIFSDKVMDQFIKPDDDNGSFGLGWRRANNGDIKWHFGPYASPSAFGHTGWTGTVTVIDPEHDLAIILLTNARHSKIEGDDKDYKFKGKQFETGKYGSVISLVYEAVLDKN